MKYIGFLISLFLLSSLAFADVAASTLSGTDYFTQVLSAIKSLGGIPWTLKIAAIVTLIISSTKVSFFQTYWAKLGFLQAFVAPTLGFIVGALTLVAAGPFSWSKMGAYTFAGAGAIILHQFLDAFKQIPGLNGVFLSAINFLEGFLQSPVQTVSVTPAPDSVVVAATGSSTK